MAAPAQVAFSCCTEVHPRLMHSAVHESGFGCCECLSRNHSLYCLCSVLIAESWLHRSWVCSRVDDDDVVVQASSAHSLRIGGRRLPPLPLVTLLSTDYFNGSNTNVTLPLQESVTDFSSHSYKKFTTRGFITVSPPNSVCVIILPCKTLITILPTFIHVYCH